MIRSVCCVCDKVYGLKFDGLAEVRDSHGYCERHYDEEMIKLKSQYAELPADRPYGGAA